MKTKYLLIPIICLTFAEYVNSMSNKDVEIDSCHVIRGNVKSVRDAIYRGADVNINFGGGTTPLIMAVIRRDDDMIKLLLDAGADPNIQDNSGETPLMKAARRKDIHRNIFELLLDAYADPNIKNENNETALIIAKKLNPRKKALLENVINKTAEKRRLKRLAIQKEIAEYSSLILDLAEIVSEYAAFSKEPKEMKLS